jgi:hypothetical protein
MKKAVPKRLIVCSELEAPYAEYVIISVTYNLSLPTCTVHNAKTLPRAIYDVT